MKRVSTSLALTALLLTGCGGPATDSSDAGSEESAASSTTPSATAQTTKKPTPKPSSTVSRKTTPKAAPKPTPSPTPVDPASRYSLSCFISGKGTTLEFETYREAWDSGEEIQHCDATRIASGSSLTDLEEQALTTAYGEGAPPENIQYMYGICARLFGIPVERTVSAGQAEEARAALMICPDHPKAEMMQAGIATGDAAGAQEATDEQARSEGKLVGAGSYLVGTDVPAGTWQSVGEKVENCYWEVSDAQGNILTNNFINIAPQFTILVPTTASGFTVEGCAFRWLSE